MMKTLIFMLVAAIFAVSYSSAHENVGNDQKYTASQALSDLQMQRKEMLDYINKVPLEDLRNHINDSPFGPVDAYHTLLYIPGHTSRHTLQIEEVKADKNFPEMMSKHSLSIKAKYR